MKLLEFENIVMVSSTECISLRFCQLYKKELSFWFMTLTLAGVLQWCPTFCAGPHIVDYRAPRPWGFSDRTLWSHCLVKYEEHGVPYATKASQNVCLHFHKGWVVLQKNLSPSNCKKTPKQKTAVLKIWKFNLLKKEICSKITTCV